MPLELGIELMDAISICGPLDYCKEKLAEWHACGMGTGLLNLPQNVPQEMIELFLRQLAPASN